MAHQSEGLFSQWPFCTLCWNDLDVLLQYPGAVALPGKSSWGLSEAEALLLVSVHQRDVWRLSASLRNRPPRQSLERPD